jgi:uncharacterized protein (TIGR02266 family)
MPDERRGTPRARLAGTRVIYQSASGQRVSARGLDVGAGGIFVQTDEPIAARKRLSIEIQVAGELAPWSAVGRVKWVREVGSPDGRPAGMGVAFIDVDDAVLAAIARLVARQPATSGATRSSRPPGREKTVLGVGAPTASAVPVAPIVAAAPAREKTVLGIAPAAPPPPTAPAAPPPAREPMPTRPADFELTDLLPQRPEPRPEPREAAPPPERSIAIDLVAKDRKEPPERSWPRAEREESLPAPAEPKRRGIGAFLLGVMVASAAAGGYAQRVQLRAWLAPYIAGASRPSPDGPTPQASPPPASASAPPPATPAPSATATTASAPARPDAGADASRAPARPAPPPAAAPPAAAPPPRRPPPAPKPPSAAPTPTEPANPDNPY